MAYYLYHISPDEPTLVQTYSESFAKATPGLITTDAVNYSKQKHIERNEVWQWDAIVSPCSGYIGTKQAISLIQCGADLFVLGRTVL